MAVSGTTPPPAPAHQQPTPQRRRWPWAVGGLAVVLLACGIGSAALIGSATHEVAEISIGASASSPPAKAAPAKAAPAKKWVTVARLKGSANKRGVPFALSGEQARLTYEVDGGRYATALVYVVPKGESLEKDGGIPEVSANGASEDTTALVKDAGQYYLDVMAANCTWTVTVQELR